MRFLLLLEPHRSTNHHSKNMEITPRWVSYSSIFFVFVFVLIVHVDHHGQIHRATGTNCFIPTAARTT